MLNVVHFNKQCHIQSSAALIWWDSVHRNNRVVGKFVRNRFALKYIWLYWWSIKFFKCLRWYFSACIITDFGKIRRKHYLALQPFLMPRVSTIANKFYHIRFSKESTSQADWNSITAFQAVDLCSTPGQRSLIAKRFSSNANLWWRNR